MRPPPRLWRWVWLLCCCLPAGPAPAPVAGGGAGRGPLRLNLELDGWKLPDVDVLQRRVAEWPRPLSAMADFHGRPVSYADFPPLRLNKHGGRRYLFYIFVNELALEAALNVIVSLRRFGIRHVLLLCENEGTAAVLARAGLYHYFPRALMQRLGKGLQEAYWGPSIWARCNFNYHMVQHGVNLVFMDADVVMVADPRPVLLAPNAQMTTAVRMASNDPWLWTFPFLDRDTFQEARSLRAMKHRHFLELNNGFSRYDSSRAMAVFYEAMKDRMLVEMRQLKRYKGWDLSARARTLWQAGLGFDSKNRTRVGNEYVLVSNPNLFNLTIMLFQTLSDHEEGMSLALPNQPVAHFAYHCFGHVSRGAARAWYTKLRIIQDMCWLVSRRALLLFRTWQAGKGEAAFWAVADNGRPCCLRRCNATLAEGDRWAHTLLADFAPLSAYPEAFQAVLRRSQGARPEAAPSAPAVTAAPLSTDAALRPTGPRPNRAPPSG
eukprot:EG_transcript_10783